MLDLGKICLNEIWRNSLIWIMSGKNNNEIDILCIVVYNREGVFVVCIRLLLNSRKSSYKALCLVMQFLLFSEARYVYSLRAYSVMVDYYTRMVFNIICCRVAEVLSDILTYCPLGDVELILKVWFSKSLYRIVAWVLAVKLLSAECHKTSLMISQHWFR